MTEIITVTEARAAVHDNVSALPSTTLPLNDCLGAVLAVDVPAPMSLPPFDQSSMDGYAIRFSDRLKPLAITGESAAGSGHILTLGEGQAIRIFTGAPLPQKADTVVMQEKVVVNGGELVINDDTLILEANVRRAGAETKKGDLVLEKQSIITPVIMGFLAGLGITQLSVFPRPKVIIIATGNELQTAGYDLKPGQIYESNSVMLTAALQQLGISSINAVRVKDDLESLASVIEDALITADLILLTGGVSVGDHDHVLAAARLCGITQIFHKVRQKPGKPLFFGRRENKIVFGLPGNPSSVLTCFYQYVLPAIGVLTRRTLRLLAKKASLSHEFKKPEGLTQFVKARLQHEGVTILGAQESYRLSSFTQANCLVELPQEKSFFNKGEQVLLHLLPH